MIRKATLRYEDQLLIENGETLSPENSAELLGATFFPDDDPSIDTETQKAIRTRAGTINDEEETAVADEPPITETEMMRAARSFIAKKHSEVTGFQPIYVFTQLQHE